MSSYLRMSTLLSSLCAHQLRTWSNSPQSQHHLSNIFQESHPTHTGDKIVGHVHDESMRQQHLLDFVQHIYTFLVCYLAGHRASSHREGGS